MNIFPFLSNFTLKLASPLPGVAPCLTHWLPHTGGRFGILLLSVASVILMTSSILKSIYKTPFLIESTHICHHLSICAFLQSVFISLRTWAHLHLTFFNDRTFLFLWQVILKDLEREFGLYRNQPFRTPKSIVLRG